MREIKFRAWNLKTKRWNTVGQHNIYHGQLMPTFEGEQVLMQYTGLKDKHGTEIYEGDIVKILHISGSGKTHEFIREVKWFGHGYASYLETYGIEVIGNIWENPELLDRPTKAKD
jgi:hypothetical protein